MAVVVNDLKIVHPFLPSLLHLASVQVAIPLCNNFNRKLLDLAFEGLHRGASSTYYESHGLEQELKILLLIPPCLREYLREIVRGLDYTASRWKLYQSQILKLKVEDCVCYWKSDGSIDGTRSAQHLVLNADIHIRDRFILACRYCLEESIHGLWVEMEASGVTKDLEAIQNSMVCFWVKRMRYGSQIPWTQAIREFFMNPRNSHLYVRYSSFFSSSRPEERNAFLFRLVNAEDDDYLLCLYAMTKEEEEKLLEAWSIQLLFIYLGWPFRSLFLDTLQKVWKYIRESDFSYFVNVFVNLSSDSETQELFEVFWNGSPLSYREKVKENPDMRKRIDSYFKKIENTRKAEFKRRNSKKLVETRLSGR